MTDTDQLREALDDEKRIIDPDFDDYTIEVNAANFAVIYQAAIRQLAATIREAGALIIIPDEKTVKRVAIAVAFSQYPLVEWEEYVPLDQGDYLKQARVILDALRDAMPDGSKE